MKIWLDDIRVKPEYYSHQAFTADEAIDFLSTNLVTEISFDHDLGLDATGYDVAKFIEEKSFLNQINRLVWKIHSANPVGRRMIKNAMINADRFWSNFDQLKKR